MSTSSRRNTLPHRPLGWALKKLTPFEDDDEKLKALREELGSKAVSEKSAHLTARVASVENDLNQF
jgi:hypothetical protein